MRPSDWPNRWEFLSRAWNGFGALGLGGVLADDLRAAVGQESSFAPRRTHFARKAKNCIFLFMQGGVSQMDSFE